VSVERLTVRIVAAEEADEESARNEIRSVRLRDVSCLRRVRTEFKTSLYAAIVVTTVGVGVGTFLVTDLVGGVAAGLLTALGTAIVLVDGIGKDIAAGFAGSGDTDDYESYLSTPSETERVRDLTVGELSDDLDAADIEHYVESGTIDTSLYEQSYEYLFVPANLPELRVRRDLTVSRRGQFVVLALLVGGVAYWWSGAVVSIVPAAVVFGGLGIWLDEYAVPYTIEVGWQDDDRLSKRLTTRSFPLEGRDRNDFAEQLADRARATRVIITFDE